VFSLMTFPLRTSTARQAYAKAMLSLIN
jgi:hypothetical protein